MQRYSQPLLKHPLTTEQINAIKIIINELAPKLNSYLNSIGNVPDDQGQMTNDK
ncbi:hypothetical protein [Nostoc sp. JL34]|uniref:hypothetical protein n=1 Tax=Nostoc sp. JL34 TaxID=2815397 RepID=UPI0025E3E7BA|nr:hypothetical protein [Nostoc sp. JL34]